jgi:hypothetical protein
MPVHVIGIPPRILQALPEKPCLANPPNLMPPRGDALSAILPHQIAKGMHHLRFQILKPLIIRPKIKRATSASLPCTAKRIVVERRIVEQLLVAFVPVRVRCRYSRRRYRSPRISVRWRNRARSSGPSLSCGIQVHWLSFIRGYLY